MVQDARRFNVYVIRLSPAVLSKKAFRDCNSNHDPRKPCVYVGMTSRTPEERLASHLEGKKASRYVKAFGIALIPRLYLRFNPMTYENAKAMEVEIARRL